jgi:hypothetical protein
MQLFNRYATLAAFALVTATAPAALYGQKSDPCAPPTGYERTTNNVSAVSDETTKASTTVLNDSAKTTDAINKLKTSIFGSKKTTKATPAAATAPAPSSQTVLNAQLQQKTAAADGAKSPETPKPCPTNKLVDAKRTTPGTPAADSAPHPAPPTTAAKATIQDEGDGKHVVLILPGQSDAKELTILPNTKNMYLEESTGDKYLVMPDGSVTRIPHTTAPKIG